MLVFLVNVCAHLSRDLLTLPVCAEKCRFNESMCGDEPNNPTSGLFARAKHPAPQCLKWSLNLDDDPYFNRPTESNVRNKYTRRLIRKAHKELAKHYSCFQSHGYEAPMMYPEEFEFITKTLLAHKPRSYLEWGAGKSTSFYPLLASGRIDVIDNYPPWCKKIHTNPTVKCLMAQGRLHFFCKFPDNLENSLGEMGYARSNSDEKKVKAAYLQALDETPNIEYDAVLVDGRFRVACAISLISRGRVGVNSVVFMHDFFIRMNDYKAVLKFYNVIGHARSVIALKPKEAGKFSSFDLEEEIARASQT